MLGPFEARSPDGAAIDFSHRKVRALLVYLTIEHGRPQSREHLATLLWARTGDDRAHRNLMELLARTGQRSEALRQYQECATALAQELGAEPGPETNQLVTEIRQGRFMPPGVGAAATMASRAAHDGEQPQLQPRVVATILVAEADGYEQSRDDDDGSGRILRRYLHVLAGRVGKHRGSIVQQAEGAVMAQFEESVDALTCAMSVQRGLSEANSDLDEASRVRCRIGVDRVDRLPGTATKFAATPSMSRCASKRWRNRVGSVSQVLFGRALKAGYAPASGLSVSTGQGMSSTRCAPTPSPSNPGKSPPLVQVRRVFPPPHLHCPVNPRWS
ncbi:MAG: hypothetical protein LJE70_06905 [Chromatiaceae bacterium]|nr:hypothetical protein [Chromatiaceae bacterium]